MKIEYSGGEVMGEIRYMISETAKQVDVEAHVLRYWEEELSLPIDRNEMGHRYYTEDDISLFKNIKELKEQGFQLKAIKMLLPELRKKGGFNMDRLLEKKEELNRAAESAFRQDALETDGGAAKKEHRQTELAQQVEPEPLTAADQMSEGTKLQQFQMIFGNIVLQALRENNQELSSGISERVSDSVLKEMDYLMRMQEEREDERFKKLDETIRIMQRSRKEAAAAKVEARRLKKLDKKEKKKRGKISAFGRKERHAIE